MRLTVIDVLLIVGLIGLVIYVYTIGPYQGSMEDFFGGYYYPYDYPYYWPYFYSGCNENVFGDIKCLPFYAHPFW